MPVRVDFRQTNRRGRIYDLGREIELCVLNPPNGEAAAFYVDQEVWAGILNMNRMIHRYEQRYRVNPITGKPCEPLQ